MDADYLELVINISEGRDHASLDLLASTSKGSLLDVHTDAHHNRSVFTFLSQVNSSNFSSTQCLQDAMALLTLAFELLDLRHHTGVHPRFGIADVVPCVALSRGHDGNFVDSELRTNAIHARVLLTEHLQSLNVGYFHYGDSDEPTLPQLRKFAFTSLNPVWSPSVPNERSGVSALGVRPLMLAWNVFLADAPLATAKAIAKSLRSPTVRSLAFQVGDKTQVSCNLISPLNTGPNIVYDAIAAQAEIERSELVGLAPKALLDGIDPARWAQLDLSIDRTIESRAKTKWA